MTDLQRIITEANIIFNNKYKYIELIKKNNIKHLKIECNIHGFFEKSIYNHIKKDKDVHYVQNHLN